MHGIPILKVNNNGNNNNNQAFPGPTAKQGLCEPPPFLLLTAFPLAFRSAVKAIWQSVSQYLKKLFLSLAIPLFFSISGKGKASSPLGDQNAPHFGPSDLKGMEWHR